MNAIPNKPKLSTILGREAVFAITLLIAFPLMSVSAKSLANLFNLDLTTQLLTLTTIYAWFAFILMGGGWMFDRRFGKPLAITGTLAGVVSLLFTSAAIILLPMVLLLLIPLVHFEWFLTRFHYRD